MGVFNTFVFVTKCGLGWVNSTDMGVLGNYSGTLNVQHDFFTRVAPFWVQNPHDFRPFIVETKLTLSKIASFSTRNGICGNKIVFMFLWTVADTNRPLK